MNKTKTPATSKKDALSKYIVGAILLFVLVFIASFGYSFIKSKVLSRDSNNLSALEKLNNGQLQGLPPGSSVKTKAEGVAVCKESGVDYCWAAVAAAFKDMSVCNQAPDKKACESDAEEFSQLNEDSGADGDEGNTEEDENSQDESKADPVWNECRKGAVSNRSDAGDVIITGKENIKFEGKTNETCCYEVSETVEGESDRVHKTCMYTDGSDSALIYNKIDGKYILWGASIKSGSQECQYFYTDEGDFQGKNCF